MSLTVNFQVVSESDEAHRSRNNTQKSSSVLDFTFEIWDWFMHGILTHKWRHVNSPWHKTRHLSANNTNRFGYYAFDLTNYDYDLSSSDTFSRRQNNDMRTHFRSIIVVFCARLSLSRLVNEFCGERIKIIVKVRAKWLCVSFDAYIIRTIKSHSV